MSTPSADPSDRERGPDEAFCRNCGALIDERAEICPECGVRQRAPPTSSVDSALDTLLEGGNPFVAAVLSAIFPGLGQLYNRELERGLVIAVASIVAAFSTLVFVGFLLFPAVWLFAIYDAYTRADRRAAELEARERTADAAGEPSPSPAGSDAPGSVAPDDEETGAPDADDARDGATASPETRDESAASDDRPGA